MFSFAAAVLAIVAGQVMDGVQNELITRSATEKTPSRSQYFSWINNTNEGATEAQTLANLAFFRWLHDEYGMVLDIYAFDAGAIDTAGETRSMDTEAFKRQFPRGFKPMADFGLEMGTHLGIWGGPDGFGNTPEDEKKRTETWVSLCRDFGFNLFKLDGVCGQLRPEKRDAFIAMMKECRKYRPELIVLNHRLDLGHAEPYVTTFLFEGAETYIDVHMGNDVGGQRTATHNRAGALARNVVPGLKRLTEDHGVCLSSCLDFWEDDLVLQAFNRCLILAPQIYGNPWLLRDEEFPKLARVFNLHRRYRDIMVDGVVLPKATYGPNAVSRGNAETRLVTLRNLTWNPVRYKVKLDEQIGLTGNGRVELRRFHPSERILGRFAYGETVEVEVLPFSSCLLTASTKPVQELGVEGCDYEVVRDIPGKTVMVKLLGMPGTSTMVQMAPGRGFSEAVLGGKPAPALVAGQAVRVQFAGNKPASPYHRKLGDLNPVDVPADAEALYEATCFSADNNALETRSLKRSGSSKIPVVTKARKAFFDQQLFSERGVSDQNLFDGKMDTDFKWTLMWGKPPRHGGSLRVDFGKSIEIDKLVIRGKAIQLPKSAVASVSADLVKWTDANIAKQGDDIVVTLPAGTKARYYRMQGVPFPLAEVEGFNKGRPVKRLGWRASHMFDPYSAFPAKAAWSLEFRLEEAAKGSYLAVALPGKHGVEGAYVALRVNGKPVGAPTRATSYPATVWEAPVRPMDGNTTSYIPVTRDMVGKKLEVVVLVMNDGVNEIRPEAWVTAYPIPFESIDLELK